MQNQTPDGMLAMLLEFLIERLNPDQLQKVKQAATQAQASHMGRKRDGGAPYVIHPLRVALDLVTTLGIWEEDLICAALLHDTLEDDPKLSAEKLSQTFGLRVAEIVALLTKPARKDQTHKEINEEYFPRIQSADVQARLIKLLDRLDNVRDLPNCPRLEKRRRIVEETRSFYLPLIDSLPTSCMKETLRTAFRQALGSTPRTGSA